MWTIRRRTRAYASVLIVLLISGVSCARSADAPPAARIDLTGAGATFPYPLYRAWFSEYGARTNVRFNYFAVGSAEGLRLLAQGDVDFGATDMPYLAPRHRRAGCEAIAIPMVSGSIAIAYNLPGVKPDNPLRFDVQTLADIYSGRISRWDAPALRALNEDVSLPAQPIVVVHRAKGSGTGRAFSDYLATSGKWSAARNDTNGVLWPVGIAAEGNQGVASEVKATLYAIGFMELAYARQNHLAVGSVMTMQSRSTLPDGGSSGYPITARTWLVLDPARVKPASGPSLVAFIRWALDSGGVQARALEYLPVATDTVARFDSVLRTMRFGQCH